MSNLIASRALAQWLPVTDITGDYQIDEDKSFAVRNVSTSDIKIRGCFLSEPGGYVVLPAGDGLQFVTARDAAAFANGLTPGWLART